VDRIDAARNASKARNARNVFMKRIALTTLGCKANWSDSEAMVQALSKAGFEIVSFEEEADAYVVNTCTVTNYAGAQSRQMLRRAKRRAPAATVVATGCYGEVGRDKLAELEGVDAIFGVGDRARLVEFLCERLGNPFDASLLSVSSVGMVPASSQSRARAFVKVQEGCDKRCAYCIVPQARGESRSMPPDEVLATLKGLSASHREVVIAGIDLGQYGRDLACATDLKALLRRIRSEEGMARLRLSTLGPRDIDDELVSMIADGGICRHVHLSIQSGSDGVLARMRRGYGAGDIERAANLLAGAVPDIAITGDVIAGFPGEGEDEHIESMQLLRGLPLAGLHVFPFSKREGTLASRMTDQNPREVKRRRAAEIREIARRSRFAYLSGLAGKPFEVIVTSRRPGEDGAVEGVTDTSVKVRLPAGQVPYGEMGRARITDVTETEVSGVWE
jgi:threonylcarbamoyladenosine tRNA methylthiotransferase MtaB